MLKLICFLLFLCKPLNASLISISTKEYSDVMPTHVLIKNISNSSNSGGAYHRSPITILDITKFGAKGDGLHNDTMAFLSAWKIACKSNHSKVKLYVPKGQEFLLQPTSFRGPCSNYIILQVEGNITAPKNVQSWRTNKKYWLEFQNVDKILITGSGFINGRGDHWWLLVRKAMQNFSFISPPTLLRIINSTNVNVENLTFINSQRTHIDFHTCSGVKAKNLTFISPANSPNTDGIHLERSQVVQIENCTMATGDDCISIGNGSFNVNIKDIKCGPGHGISVGSLGRRKTYAEVHDILVDGAIMNSTRYGVRIKTWQGGRGYAKFIWFQNIKMHRVRKPISINQFYHTKLEKPYTNQTSNVEVGAIFYKNISGTTTSEDAISFNCSKVLPCHHVILEDINLEHVIEGKMETLCSSVMGYSFGIVEPPSCLDTRTLSRSWKRIDQCL